MEMEIELAGTPHTIVAVGPPPDRRAEDAG
jgi:hypothetical protein